MDAASHVCTDPFPMHAMPMTPNRDRPQHGVTGISSTILAFDFGERFIGVAVGDQAVRSAHPLTTIESRSEADRFAKIAQLIEEWRPGRLVVGEPVAQNGGRHDLADRVARFARQLNGRFGLPVHCVDEQFTSVDAAADLSLMGRGGHSDKMLVHPMAACLILEAYLNDQPS
jgi:putative holliday junction resolvase